MKNLVILVALLLAIPSLHAQKKEIKKAQDAVSSGNLASATSYLKQAKRIFAAADSETRAHYYVVEAELKFAKKDLDMEGLESISNSLKLAHNYDVSASLRERIAHIQLNLNQLSANVALAEFKKKNYSQAATLYMIAFQSTGDTIHFLKAARSHLLAKEYNDAFKSYNRLFNMGYSNAKIRYVATNKKSDKKEAFASAADRNEAVELGTHKNPEIVTTGSTMPELLRGITSASIPLNKQHEAEAIIDRALAKTSGDNALLNQALHLYIQLDAKEKYQNIMDQLAHLSPNDPNLFYNFGVSSGQNNEIERAKMFYKKALTIAPDHMNAKSNLTLLLLDEDVAISDEMNSLGMSEADENRYKELKQQRIKLYSEVLPYLESIVRSKPQNNTWTKKLMGIYGFMGNESKLAILQEKLDD
tara:strand:- start:87821 stop:89071 length:1251 start_codon:yes stop_codon:yes gene_type:complete